MYPYHTQKKKSLPLLLAKETPSLADDRRLQELLLQAKQDASAMEKKYHTLQQEPRLQKSTDTLQAIANDSKKHQRILQELLFTLFSDTVEEALEEIAEGDIPPKAAEALLEELLFQEMDDISFYRTLLAVLAAEEMDEDLWYLILEIITDKQNHTAALNHLYTKYLHKTSVN